MPAVSKAQQRFMGMVYATKKGDMTNPSPEVAQAAASMKKSAESVIDASRDSKCNISNGGHTCACTSINMSPLVLTA